ncbi:MAG: hypothetical protein KR126chlam2_00933 [Chlamydiae bacterium]|nr:hypothetical protein [Chlamydiota bacterium]
MEYLDAKHVVVIREFAEDESSILSTSKNKKAEPIGSAFLFAEIMIFPEKREKAFVNKELVSTSFNL